MNEIPIELEPLISWSLSVGSRVTCNPAPTNTDDDRLVLVLPVLMPAFEALCPALGFRLGGSRPEAAEPTGKDAFTSWTRGELNLIVTADEMFAKRFQIATGLAQRFNLLEKHDRISLFQAVLYGNFA